MFKRHLENIKRQKTELERITQETKIEFKKSVENAVKNGWLPKSIIEKLSRIDSVTVGLNDVFLDLKTTTEATMDGHGRMFVNNDLLQEKILPRLKQTLFHEFLHELAGKSITIFTDSKYDLATISNRKSGVSIFNSSREYRPNRWLNEAITEWLALELSGYKNLKKGYKGSESYTVERLEKNLVVEAYFENFSSDQPKERREVYFTKLIQRINQIEGPKGFTKLENQQIAVEIEKIFYHAYINPVEKVKSETSPDAKFFDITLTIGTDPETVIEKKFVRVIKSIMSDDRPTSSMEEQQKQLSNVLESVKDIFGGKAKISVVERQK
jgi:hypothetical protein